MCLLYPGLSLISARATRSEGDEALSITNSCPGEIMEGCCMSIVCQMFYRQYLIVVFFYLLSIL